MYPKAIAERDIEICALVAQGIPASTIAERFRLPELDVMAIVTIGPEIPRHDLWLQAEHERQLAAWEIKQKELETYSAPPRTKLDKTLQKHLEAVAHQARKGADEIRRARARIFSALNEKGGSARLWMPRVDQGKGDRASEFCNENTPLAHIVEGIVRSGSLYTLTAKIGAGNTAFNVIIKVAVESERGDILGRDVTRGRVAYLACENPDDIRMRFMIAARQWGILLNEIADRIVILGRCKKPEGVCEDLKRLSVTEPFGLFVVDASAAPYSRRDINDGALWVTGDNHRRAVREWRAALSTHGGNGESEGKDSLRDWVAVLVRKARLQSREPGWRRHSEATAIEGSVNVTYADLSEIEKRAANMIIGKRRPLRVLRNDRAEKLAKAVRDEWIKPVPQFRRKRRARTLSIDAIVLTVLPILDDLANGPIKLPMNYEDDPARMEPSALGALVAIARMWHPNANYEYIRHLVQNSRQSGNAKV
jgi:hypothetical protein